MAEGTLLAIARKSKVRAPVESLEAGEITVDNGLTGDHRGTPGSRQITVVSKQAWDATCRELDDDVPWTYRRANLLVDGIDLKETAGRRLTVGEVELEITGETEPCPRMDEQHQGLTTALAPDWRGGVTCRVLAGGRVTVGDAVTLDG